MRPSSTPATIVVKLSSLSTRSAASRATSVPLRPMATPMLARRSAGASLTPSPVTATKCPADCAASTIASFCSGVTRANTLTLPMASASCAGDASCTCEPCITSSGPAAIPSSPAIASAVSGWSPVTMTTRMPASRQRRTAAATPSRSGSINPTSARNCRPTGSRHRLCGSDTASNLPSASASTRWPSCAIALTSRSRNVRWPASSRHMSNTRSGAPLTATQPDPSRRWNEAANRRSGSYAISRDDRPLREELVALDASFRREHQQCQVGRIASCRAMHRRRRATPLRCTPLQCAVRRSMSIRPPCRRHRLGVISPTGR